MNREKLQFISKLLRYYILISTTKAGTGHPSSSLSSVELMSVLMFNGFFKYNIDQPDDVNNDRLIFSKGHASPLFYSLWALAGGIKEPELMTLRSFGSRLEGHPTIRFPFTEAPTGSLGQGLSIGLGIALNNQFLDKTQSKTYVLMGDSEMAEGSIWEAMQLAAYYKVVNLVGIIDVNGLGQRGQTMYGHDVELYQKKVEAFGWQAIVIDGHDITQIIQAYQQASTNLDRPVMIIASTIKGKGVTLMEGKEGWHGKVLSQDQLTPALQELGHSNVDKNAVFEIAKPLKHNLKPLIPLVTKSHFSVPKFSEVFSTRKAYGQALVEVAKNNPKIVCLDAETSNSTFAEIFKEAYPDRFFEMFIAEQNMVGVAQGFSSRGKIPFVSTFGAFFSRAFDQIRMSQYAESNIKYIGSHVGVSIGEDGSSQMALEDLAMFRTQLNGLVLYPSDAVSTYKLVQLASEHYGNVYIRTTRADTPVLYSPEQDFKIGGSNILRYSHNDQLTIIAAGITVHEAIKAYNILLNHNITIRIIDLYSIKPVDLKTLIEAAQQTKALIVVEDHMREGGLYSAVCEALASQKRGINTPIYSLAVTKMPQSGAMDQLLIYEEISSEAIVTLAQTLI